MNQQFFYSASEERAWTKLCPADAPQLPFSSLLVQRDGIRTTMNGMAHVWIKAQDG
jgi:hypothetical protein